MFPNDLEQNLFGAAAFRGHRNPSAWFSLCGCAAGELVGPDETTELDGVGGETRAGANETQDPATLKLIDVLTELGADKVFKE